MHWQQPPQRGQRARPDGGHEEGSRQERRFTIQVLSLKALQSPLFVLI